MEIGISTYMNGQNVGIGTTTPTAKLDVSSPSTFISRFNSSTNQGFITVAENGIARAYMGSYSGAVEDVDFGTTASNLPGKLHLTIQSNPKLTIDNSGNVGIGTIAPSEKLELSGNIKMTGELKPNGTAGLAGQVLTSNGNGSMQWAAPVSSNSNSGSGTSGNGGWGDCSIFNIDSLNAIGDPMNNLAFGILKVAISGNYAVVGGYAVSEGGLDNSGAVNVYKFNSTTNQWAWDSKLVNPSFEAGDQFGTSVSISGNYILIGCIGDDDGSLNSGSASIFKLNTSNGLWEHQGKLYNPNAASNDEFGHSVFINGDYAIISAIYDDENAVTDCGSATIFKRNTSTGIWESQGKLVNGSAANLDQFGSAVSISGDYAIVGARWDDEFGFTDNGSATIFKRNSSTGVWENQGKINAIGIENNREFGGTVGISGDWAAVGAKLDDYLGLTDSGMAAIYRRNATTNMWEYIQPIYNQSPASQDHFGQSLSVSGDYILMGANFDDLVNGNDSREGSSSIFKKQGSLWFTHQKFTNPYPMLDDEFGYSVAIDGVTKRFICAAPGLYSKGTVYFGTVK